MRIGGSDSDGDEDPAKAAAYIRFSTLGFQVVITFVVLALAGAWLDDKFGSSPWGTLGGVGLGLVAMVKIMLHEGTDQRPSGPTAGSNQVSDSEEDEPGEAVE
ncbi:MAG: AtpZ/AtpI family protein [Planctomycetes bacterium]|nr:AtpZ/AtpI family protein [Planctomycetota bacterium]